MEIPSLSTCGQLVNPSDEIPYLLRERLLKGKDETTVEFHGQPLVLVDPIERKVFQMPSDYWFVKSPFGAYIDFKELKRTIQNHNRAYKEKNTIMDSISQYPFVMIPLK